MQATLKRPLTHVSGIVLGSALLVDGFVRVTSVWARLYFVAFHITTTIVFLKYDWDCESVCLGACIAR